MIPLYLVKRRFISYILRLYFFVYERVFVVLKCLLPDFFFFSIRDCEKSLRQNFFYDKDDVGHIFEILKGKAEYATSLIDEADQLLHHNFAFLGIEKQVKGKICWNEDISTGFKWPNMYYRYCNTVYDNESDIIMVWELSRFQHLFTLGKAFKLTGDRKYFDEVNFQIRDWLQNTPYKIGPNWVTAMDAAIRSINWILVISLLYSDAKLSRFFKTRLFVSLYLHAKHIRSNLPLRRADSGQLIGTNHYMASLAGCLFLGVFFRGSAFGNQLFNWALSQFPAEIERQVHPDGANFERATCYHRLVGEIIASALILLKLNDTPLPERVFDRFSKMIGFTVNYTRPDHRVPQVGDTDDGRLYRLGRYFDQKLYSHYHFIELGRILFNMDPLHYRKRTSELMEDNLWITYRLGKKNRLPIAKGLSVNPTPEKLSAFPETGFHIFRNNGDYLLALAGKVGSAGLGNHTHNDNLSFELCFKSIPVIIDPGCYTYTSDLVLRQLYRSTAMHNSLQIGDTEINHISLDNIFRMEENSFPKVIKFSNDGRLFWNGVHFGYCRSRPRVIHNRKIYYFYQEPSPYFIIEDLIVPLADYPHNDLPECYSAFRNEARNAHDYNAKLSFHFSPSVSVSRLDDPKPFDLDHVTRGIRQGDPILDDIHPAPFGYQIETAFFGMVLMFYSDSDAIEGCLEDYFMAESYRKTAKAKKAVLNIACSGSCSITTYIGSVFK